MLLIDHLDKIVKPFANAVITIGNFDGVHIGHQALFHQVIEKADALGGTSVAMTFEPHPLRVLKKNGHLPLITRYEQKVDLISKSGIDVLICVPFTREFATISAQRFVEEILIRKIGMKAVVVGKDYTFGRNREGNLDLLRTFSETVGFEVIVADWIPSATIHGRISSTKIRELVMDGKVDEAGSLLGRHYQVLGEVTVGRNRGGRLLGFPTANLRLSDELCPKTGVYAVTVEIGDEKFKGVANIGFSPTFDDHVFTVEVYIIDFGADIYGQKIRVNFIRRIRDEIKFRSVADLSAQIRKDVAQAREIVPL